MFYVRIGIDFTDGNQRERFLWSRGWMYALLRLNTSCHPLSLTSIVACNGFTSAHNIEVSAVLHLAKFLYGVRCRCGLMWCFRWLLVCFIRCAVGDDIVQQVGSLVLNLRFGKLLRCWQVKLLTSAAMGHWVTYIPFTAGICWCKLYVCQILLPAAANMSLRMSARVGCKHVRGVFVTITSHIREKRQPCLHIRRQYLHGLSSQYCCWWKSGTWFLLNDWHHFCSMCIVCIYFWRS